MHTFSTFDEFCENEKSAVAKSIGQAEPDGDLLPMLSLYNGKELVVVAVPQMGDPKLKEVIAKKTLPEVIAQVKAQFGALVLGGWIVRNPNMDVLALISPSQDPDRKEIAILHCFRRNDERMYVCEVQRHPDRPPTASEWETFHEAGGISGLYAGLGRFTEVP